MIALALGVGLVVGAVMGALGGGGAIIAIPALIFLLDQSPQAATTASLVIIGITALAGVVQHGRAGRVRFTDGTAFALLGAAGAFLGARVSVDTDADVVLALFSVLLLAVAAVMIRRSRQQAAAVRESPSPWLGLRPWHLDVRRGALVLVVASAVGVLTGFFGVGGGFAIVPALTIVLGLPMAEAVGTSLWVITLTSGVGLLSRLGAGEIAIDWLLVALFTATAMAGSVAGSRAANRLDATVLTRGFAALLVAVAVVTAARSLPQLL